MSVLEEHFTLSNGHQIPKLGFGTWQTPQNVAPGAVRAALKAGYTHLDTARAYRNEDGVGQGLRDSGVPREQVFVTTKVPADAKSYEDAKAEIAQSLELLQTGWIDLLLIHCPRPWAKFRDLSNRYFPENLAVWRAMEEAVKAGQVRSIGVSNFEIDDITNITDHAEIAPVVNQIEYHIGCTPDELVAYCQSHGILVEAYSPIATGELLSNPAVAQVAGRCGVSVAQVCIRYALQKGTLPLPKSTHPEFIEQNTQVDFTISDADMTMLDAIAL
ncbi:MAG: aldo/keto reductase [Propionibacteriaceae bacterium]|nr:aldo/keto reductase [Propionibacteriaceae bacterium]